MSHTLGEAVSSWRRRIDAAVDKATRFHAARSSAVCREFPAKHAPDPRQ